MFQQDRENRKYKAKGGGAPIKMGNKSSKTPNFRGTSATRVSLAEADVVRLLADLGNFSPGIDRHYTKTQGMKGSPGCGELSEATFRPTREILSPRVEGETADCRID